jgi:hypothetical protein
MNTISKSLSMRRSHADPRPNGLDQGIEQLKSKIG